MVGRVRFELTTIRLKVECSTTELPARRRSRATAAYRHEGHWAEIIGREVLQTIPYTWWKQYDRSTREPTLAACAPSLIRKSVVRTMRIHIRISLRPEPGRRYAVVGVGTDLEASILSASIALELGVRTVWAKAISA